MRQQRTYGSVRGAISDDRPYRDRRFCNPVLSAGWKAGGGQDWPPHNPQR